MKEKNPRCGPKFQSDLFQSDQGSFGMLAMNVYDYTRSIDACVKQRDLSGAWKWFDRMKAEGVTPNIVTYGAMMNGCSKVRDMGRVLALWDEMIGARLTPNVRVFNIVLGACAIHADVPRAMNLFERMKRHFNLEPDLFTYNTLLNVCAKARDLATAVAIVDELTDAGLKGNAVTFSILLDCYAQTTTPDNGEGRLRDCLRLVEIMKRDGLSPDTWVYNNLIKVCQRAGLMKKALEIAQDMRNEQINFEISTYTSLIDGLSKASDFTKDEIEHLSNGWLDEMEERRIVPNVTTYTALLNLCIALGDLERAKTYFDGMKRDRIKPNNISYGALVKCYEKLGDPSKKPEYLDSCFEPFKEMERKNIRPDRAVYTSLLNACANAGDLDAAVTIWSKMKESRGYPTVSNFEAVIKLSLSMDNLERAYQFLDEMEIARMKPSKTIFLSFFQFFADKQLDEDAQELYKRMENVGVEPDADVVNLCKRLRIE